MSVPSSPMALKGRSSGGEMSVQDVELTVVRNTCPVCPGLLPLKPPSTPYITVGSFGSKTARMTLRLGRFLVISVKLTPEGGPTVAANELVDTNTRRLTAMTTLLLLVLATSTFPVLPNAPEGPRRIRQLVPPLVLCHKLLLPLT